MESPFFPHVRKPCVSHILIIPFGDWLDVVFLTADTWLPEIPCNNFVTVIASHVPAKHCMYMDSFIFPTMWTLVHFTDFETHLSRPDVPSHSQIFLHAVGSCSRSSWVIKRLSCPTAAMQLTVLSGCSARSHSLIGTTKEQ